MKLASSRGISLKAAWGIVKRGGNGTRRKTRTASRKSTRKRSTMARKSRKSGGRRGGRKGTWLTPKNIIVGAPAAIGVVKTVETVMGQAKFYGGINKIGWNNQAGGSESMVVFKPGGGGVRGTEAAKALAPLLEGAGVSYVAKKAANAVSRVLPAPVNKLANTRLIRV